MLAAMTCRAHLITVSLRLALPVYLLVSCLRVSAREAADSTRVVSIDEVTVTESRRSRVLRSATPVQVLDAEGMRRLGALQLSDAVKMFSGVVIKDYGGIGGLKTISVRSLGAAHTGVVYDGVPVTDAQTGQIDLGRYSLDNVEAVSLASGQDDDIFRTARQYASASVLSITTSQPVFDGKPVNVAVAVKAGSFGMASPAFRLEGRINDRLAMSLSGDWQHARGDYPYIQPNGEASVRRRRENSDIDAVHAEANLFGRFDGSRTLAVKAYFYDSRRGLPTNILYNEFAGQRLWDRNYLVQARYQRRYGRRWALQAVAKWNRSSNRYYDPVVYNDKGYDDDRYRQDEGYVSATLLCRPVAGLSLALAADGVVNSLTANLTDFARPVRYTLLNVLAARYVHERFTVMASVLSTATRETVRLGQAAPDRHRLSPSFALSVKPFAGKELRLRLLCKDIFRLPTFNDLYYGTVGTRTLRPEKALQLDGGVTWQRRFDGVLSHVSLAADAFYNRVTDKIVAVPSRNLFIWSMMNIGRVDIKGVETNAELSLSLPCDISLSLASSYTWQRALDKTDKHSLPYKATYNHQIPYTPRHSGSLRCDLHLPWFDLGWSAVVSGERYCNQYNSPDYRLAGYNEHNLSLYRDFTIGAVRLKVQAEVLNVGGTNHEIVKNYPMPGRQYRGGIVINY